MERKVETGLYGEFVMTREDKVEEAKGVLLESLIHTIRELAKEEGFWIVKTVDRSDPIMMAGCPNVAKDAPVTVAWKIHFPQMEEC